MTDNTPGYVDQLDQGDTEQLAAADPNVAANSDQPGSPDLAGDFAVSELLADGGN